MKTIRLLKTQKANFDITYILHKTKQWGLNRRNLLFSGQWRPLLM